MAAERVPEHKQEETIMSVLKCNDQSLLQTSPSVSQAPAPGLLSDSTPARGGECHIAREEARDQIHLDRWGADASAAGSSDAQPGSVREFSLFAYGAGI
jgi:hypothetical protein